MAVILLAPVSVMISENCIPDALSAPAVRGIRTLRQPNSAAIGAIPSPPAPPPATSVESAGFIPSFTVNSLIACIIFSLATAIMAKAVCSIDSFNASASGLIAFLAASSSKCILPPRKCLGSM